MKMKCNNLKFLKIIYNIYANVEIWTFSKVINIVIVLLPHKI